MKASAVSTAKMPANLQTPPAVFAADCMKPEHDQANEIIFNDASQVGPGGTEYGLYTWQPATHLPWNQLEWSGTSSRMPGNTILETTWNFLPNRKWSFTFAMEVMSKMSDDEVTRDSLKKAAAKDAVDFLREKTTGNWELVD